MPSTEVINLRVPAVQKAIIDRAAALSGQNRTAFILEHAVRSAEEFLTERTHFTLSETQWKEFTAALDAPVSSNPALERLIATPAPWDTQE